MFGRNELSLSLSICRTIFLSISFLLFPAVCSSFASCLLSCLLSFPFSLLSFLPFLSSLIPILSSLFPFFVHLSSSPFSSASLPSVFRLFSLFLSLLPYLPSLSPLFFRLLSPYFLPSLSPPSSLSKVRYHGYDEIASGEVLCPCSRTYTSVIVPRVI